MIRHLRKSSVGIMRSKRSQTGLYRAFSSEEHEFQAETKKLWHAVVPTAPSARQVCMLHCDAICNVSL